jgi:hypothetical protein
MRSQSANMRLQPPTWQLIPALQTERAFAKAQARPQAPQFATEVIAVSQPVAALRSQSA